jgi:cell division septation protein DedD
MKKIGFIVTLLALVLMCFVSCKSRRHAYKAAYEQAQDDNEEDFSEVDYYADEPELPPPPPPTPLPTEPQPAPPSLAERAQLAPPAAPPTPRREKIVAVSGEDDNKIKLYSVVIGSFVTKANAYSLKERMQEEGYMPVLGENEQGMLRVILTSHETKLEAENSRADIRARYRPEFQDAWILERKY